MLKKSLRSNRLNPPTPKNPSELSFQMTLPITYKYNQLIKTNLSANALSIFAIVLSILKIKCHLLLAWKINQMISNGMLFFFFLPSFFSESSTNTVHQLSSSCCFYRISATLIHSTASLTGWVGWEYVIFNGLIWGHILLFTNAICLEIFLLLTFMCNFPPLFSGRHQCGYIEILSAF